MMPTITIDMGTTPETAETFIASFRDEISADETHADIKPMIVKQTNVTPITTNNGIILLRSSDVAMLIPNMPMEIKIAIKTSNIPAIPTAVALSYFIGIKNGHNYVKYDDKSFYQVKNKIIF
jgi:hypothetical protein